jgi:hypothetical protein
MDEEVVGDLSAGTGGVERQFLRGKFAVRVVIDDLEGGRALADARAGEERSAGDDLRVSGQVKRDPRGVARVDRIERNLPATAPRIHRGALILRWADNRCQPEAVDHPLDRHRCQPRPSPDRQQSKTTDDETQDNARHRTSTQHA